MTIDRVTRRWERFFYEEQHNPAFIVISPKTLAELRDEEISFGQYIHLTTVNPLRWRIFGAVVVLAQVDDEIFVA